MSSIGSKLPPCGWIRRRTRVCGSRSCVAMAGDVNPAARCRTWKFITSSFASQSGDDSEENLITLCTKCHSLVHC